MNRTESPTKKKIVIAAAVCCFPAAALLVYWAVRILLFVIANSQMPEPTDSEYFLAYIFVYFGKRILVLGGTALFAACIALAAAYATGGVLIILRLVKRADNVRIRTAVKCAFVPSAIIVGLLFLSFILSVLRLFVHGAEELPLFSAVGPLFAAAAVNSVLDMIVLHEPKPSVARTAAPPWEEVVRAMRDNGLTRAGYTIEEVRYSRDGARRCMIYRSEAGFYTYFFEELRAYTADELAYFPSNEHRYAYWYPSDDGGKHLFGTKAEAVCALEAEPEYKNGFGE